MHEMDNDRMEMYLRLKEVLGDTVGDTVMKSIPPVDWSEFARRSDINHLAEITDIRFKAVESRLSGIVAGMWAMGSLMVTLFVAQFTLIVTKL